MWLHVWIWFSEKDTNPDVRYNLTEDDLNEIILKPYFRGDPFVVSGRTVVPSQIHRMRVTHSEENASVIYNAILEEKKQKFSKLEYMWTVQNWEILGRTTDATNRYVTKPPGSASTTMTSAGEVADIRNPRAVFVVHGRNLVLRDAMFLFLRSIELQPIEWSSAIAATGKPTPYVGEILECAFRMAQAFVILFTPDDEGQLREEYREMTDPPHETSLVPQARLNVVFEAGMAIGQHPDRTVLVEVGSLRPFSDIDGLHVVRMDDSSQRRQELANRLKSAGCLVNLVGTDWHTAGDFSGKASNA